MPKILFIQPTQYGADGSTLCKQKTIHLPGLAFALLAAYLPDHWQAELVIEIQKKASEILGIPLKPHAFDDDA